MLLLDFNASLICPNLLSWYRMRWRVYSCIFISLTLYCLKFPFPLGKSVGNTITNNPYVLYSFMGIVEIVGHCTFCDGHSLPSRSKVHTFVTFVDASGRFATNEVWVSAMFCRRSSSVAWVSKNYDSWWSIVVVVWSKRLDMSVHVVGKDYNAWWSTSTSL